MNKLFYCGIAIIPLAASAAFGGIVYDNTGTTNEFVTGIPSIYFDDANLAAATPVQINQFNIGYENLSFAPSTFDLLVQFYDTVDYGAASGVPIGTNPIGSLIDITGLSAAAGDVGATGLVSLTGTLPVSTTGTVGYEFEFVTPGTTTFNQSDLNTSVVPIFRSGAPSVGSSSGYFAYDFLKQGSIVGDASSGDVFTFVNPSNVAAQIGAVAGPAVTVLPGQKYLVSAGVGTTISEITIAGLTIDASGTVAPSLPVTQANHQLLVVSSPGLSIAGSVGKWTGTLDLGNNDLDLPGASLTTVIDQIHQGYSNGRWNGNGGIMSSAAAASTVNALGVIQNNQGGSPLFTTFDGYAVGASDILVKYTYYGDADLNGHVDGSDYSRIDYGYLMHLTGWYNGDFNYDGVVDGSDYTLIDNAFNIQGASLSAADPTTSLTAEIAASSVPEPATVSLLTLISIGALSRRRVLRRAART